MLNDKLFPDMLNYAYLLQDNNTLASAAAAVIHKQGPIRQNKTYQAMRVLARLTAQLTSK